MVKLLKRTGRTTGRYVALVAITATLTACGGGSGDTDTVGDQDTDLDGIPDSEDDDIDGDGILNIDDEDANGDGVDDIIGAQDLDNDGIANIDDDDADRDNILDALDPFVDLDQNGRDDVTNVLEGQTNAGAITEATPCGVESGNDNNSSNDSWSDNCTVRRTLPDGSGQFADSLYTVGIQRISWCAGFDGDTPVNSYIAFADGEFGPSSEMSLEGFQAGAPNPIAADGQVGPTTWGKLQGAVERLDQGAIITNPDNPSQSIFRDPYGFSEGRCAGITLFYRVGVVEEETQATVEGELGWLLAKNQPNESQFIPFSIASPFGGILD